jgi:hypothetical protein
MGRTSRLLAALALGLALAGLPAATAVAQPTPPTIEDHKAEEAGRAQTEVTLTEAEQRRIARVPEPYVPAPVSAAPAAKDAPTPAATDVDVLATLLLGLVGGVVGGVAALAGWAAATRRRPRQPASAT